MAWPPAYGDGKQGMESQSTGVPACDGEQKAQLGISMGFHILFLIGYRADSGERCLWLRWCVQPWSVISRA
jgi:hypothetical protein